MVIWNNPRFLVFLPFAWFQRNKEDLDSAAPLPHRQTREERRACLAATPPSVGYNPPGASPKVASGKCRTNARLTIGCARPVERDGACACEN
jgi:hypothetical protein